MIQRDDGAKIELGLTYFNCDMRGRKQGPDLSSGRYMFIKNWIIG